MRASEFVRVQPQGTLTIFDIDDTLLHTTAKIRVVKDGETVRELTNQQFNNYKLQPGEEFDFGEFRDAEKFARESTPIRPMIRELKAILAYTRGRVIMLTARADFDDRDTFLDTFNKLGIDMSKVHVHRAGNLPGNDNPAYKKAVWVRRYLDTGKYRQVSLYDDSMTNLRVFKELAAEYPAVTFNAYYIGPKGAATEVEEDQHPNERPRGPEFKPTMPAGTVRVDVSDVYDWYKLGQHISDLKGLGKHDFGKGPPSTILAFGDEDLEHEYIKNLEKTGLTTTDIDPIDPKQPRGLKRQKTDPTFNVNENANIKAIVLSKLPKYFATDDPLEKLVPERTNVIYALHPEKYAATFYSLTNKDLDKIKFYRPKMIDIPQGTLVGDMALANKFYRSKDPVEKQLYAKLYRQSLQPYPVNLSAYKMPELLIPKTAINEAFDQPYKLKWEKGEFGDYDALAQLNDGTHLSIMFNLTDQIKDHWVVEFYRNNSQEVTGEGDAPRVFATVLTAVQQFIKKKKPESLFFSAVKENDPTGSRTRLYDRLVQRYANGLGYNLQKEDYPEQTGYRLTQTQVQENFADGKNPGRKGLSQRVGISKGASIEQLEKLKSAPGEKGRLARWQLNMRRGKKRAGSKN